MDLEKGFLEDEKAVIRKGFWEDEKAVVRMSHGLQNLRIRMSHAYSVSPTSRN
jgi:hypothetical protein